ncbi:hypothetical protein [Fibrisoma montanum]|nr:hypothetical protein [Fibrisoma montanum]
MEYGTTAITVSGQPNSLSDNLITNSELGQGLHEAAARGAVER